MKILLALILTWIVPNVYGQLTPTLNDIFVPMRDNESLSVDVYIPSGVDSAEVILIQTPYNKNMFENGLPLGVGSNLDGQPFIWVVADWRGFYGSNGADLSNFSRGEDGYDLCQWISEQMWHKSRIGTWGPSALGGVQYATAREQHPNHTCAVPLVAHPQQSYDSYYYGGVLEEARLQQLDALGYGLSPVVLGNPYYSTLWQFAENDSWYPSDIIIPTLQIGGWYDHNIDKMMDWYKATRDFAEISVRDEQWLLVGPWVHGGTGIAYVGSSAQGELNYPNAADMNNTMAWDFLNYYLLDTPNNWQATDLITYYETGENVWSTSNATTINLPLDDVLFLQENALLNGTTGTASTSFVSDPNNPAPTLGGANLSLNLDQGPYDQISLESRNDIITFQSDILYADAHISGRILADLFVSADQPDCDIMVHLVDVYPDGRNMLITDGTRRMRFRNGYTQANEAFMTSGQIYPVQITLPFTNYTWKSGHRIKIYIGANSATRWNVNLQDGGTMYQPGIGNVANISIHHNSTYPSKITLPGTNSSLNTTALETLDYSVYPNPSQDLVHIEGGVFENYILADLTGKTVLQGSENSFSMQQLPAGVYVLQITNAQETQHFNIVKQ